MNNGGEQKYPSGLRAKLMDQDTSIRTNIAAPAGGRLITMGFPGLAFDISGNAYLDPERLEATLTHQALAACDLLVVLVEDEELPDGALAALTAFCASRQISVRHLPIPDYQAPGPLFEAAWDEIAGDVQTIQDAGRTLALSCHYGAGRSGMIAAGLLIEQGLGLSDAIDTVRDQFPESIESDVQLDWLAAKDAEQSATQAG